MIDTRKAVVKPETQIAKFNDKFSMKTVLQWDEEIQEFKPKPVSRHIDEAMILSNIQFLFLLVDTLSTPS